jgi:ribosome-binding protein aMBF1 (putative translation factor)
MNLTETIGAAHWTEVDLRPLRCLICGCHAETTSMRVSQIEDGCWLAICDDCCEFFGTASAWRRAFRIHDAMVRAKKDPDDVSERRA